MAAFRDFPAPSAEIVDLRRVSGTELDPLLLEETVEWREQLDWDFARSADMVHHFTDAKGLNGCVLRARGEVLGYAYSVLEGEKGLIGDIYIRSGWRNPATTQELFKAALDSLIQTPRIRRIESQLMLVDRSAGDDLQRERSVRLYDRVLMSLDAGNQPLPASSAGRRFHLEPWGEQHNEAAAGVIALAYAGHVDSEINDQYRSIAGARRFLYNIVQFPGCGLFFRQGSLVAFDLETGWMSGVILVSFVGPETGHITQVCVTPHARHTGLGYELLRQAIAILKANGAKRISLTVTRFNREALYLYVRCGFREVRGFYAYVWEA